MNEYLFKYYYSVADKNGYLVSRYKLLTRTEFISVTGIDIFINYRREILISLFFFCKRFM